MSVIVNLSMRKPEQLKNATITSNTKHTHFSYDNLNMSKRCVDICAFFKGVLFKVFAAISRYETWSRLQLRGASDARFQAFQSPLDSSSFADDQVVFKRPTRNEITSSHINGIIWNDSSWFLLVLKLQHILIYPSSCRLHRSKMLNPNIKDLKFLF